MTLVTREGKGSELTWDELDGNFEHCLDRGNHTGTQTASTISDFNSAADSVAVAAVAAHVAAADPHTQYTTAAEAAAAAPVQSVNGQTGAVDLSGSYAPLSHVGSGGAAHTNVVAGGAAGFMTGADKTKLDGIAPGAQVNVGTDISIGYNPAYVFVNSSTGTDATLDAATTLAAGVMSAADKSKLDGIAPGATANANTDSLAEGSTNKYFTEGRVRSTVLPGLSLLTGGVISAADSVLSALGKLQKQISDAVTAIGGKQDTLVSGTNIKTVNGSSLLGAGDLAISGSGMANPMTSAGDIIVGASGGVPARLALGSALQTLRVNAAGTGLEYAAASGGGGLTNLVEAKTTGSPNATVPVVSLSVSITETNGDVAIVAKGTGSLMLQVPDGTAAGGNKRGTNAVDLSTSRGNAIFVASGANSAVLAGDSLRASGQYSVALGGRSNSATGDRSSCVSGDTCTASNSYSITLGGQGNTSSGTYALCLSGASLTASGSYSVASGLGSIANGVHSYAQGAYATARQVQGAWAFSAGRFGTTGDAQAVSLQVRGQTTNATPLRLTSTATAASGSNQMAVQSSASYAFKGQIVARGATGNSSAWSIQGLIKSNSGGTVSFVGTPTVSLIAQDAAASSWAVAAALDTTNWCLAVDVTGAASTTIRWLCELETVQLVY